jgi:hypothetical protein
MRRFQKLLLLLPLLALVLLAVVFFLTMAHEDERLAGTNSVNDQGLVVQVGGGSRVCQQTLVPRDAARARLPVAPIAQGGPAMSMTIVAGRRTLATSRIASGWTDDTLSFPFTKLTSTHPGATLCMRNMGRAAVRFGGLAIGVPTSTKVNGVAEKAVITIEYFRPGRSDWWAVLPAIAHRAGVLKGSLSGAWSFWLAAALVLVAGGLALGVAIRGGRQ